MILIKKMKFTAVAVAMMVIVAGSFAGVKTVFASPEPIKLTHVSKIKPVNKKIYDRVKKEEKKVKEEKERKKKAEELRKKRIEKSKSSNGSSESFYVVNHTCTVPPLRDFDAFERKMYSIKDRYSSYNDWADDFNAGADEINSHNDRWEPTCQTYIDAGHVVKSGNLYLGHNPGAMSKVSSIRPGDRVKIDGVMYRAASRWYDSGYIKGDAERAAIGNTSFKVLQFCVKGTICLVKCVR